MGFYVGRREGTRVGKNIGGGLPTEKLLAGLHELPCLSFPCLNQEAIMNSDHSIFLIPVNRFGQIPFLFHF